jgi:acetyl esterase/lipase
MFQWVSFFSNRIRPSHPSVSPIFGNLKGLPPTLVHASDAEMLLDDAARYVNKVQAAGSPVVLQTWRNMVHVWHIFVSDLPEAQEAFAADAPISSLRQTLSRNLK